jgi:hypothetical protein
MKNFKSELDQLKPIGVCSCNPKFVIYTTDMSHSPHVVIEIAKRRKQSFESVGVKINSELDLDDYDVSSHQQSQMFIWDTEKEEIVGGYRYSYNNIVSPQDSPMGKYFVFTEKFSKENWIHLGRSFLAVEYQQSRYGIIALMDALGCLFAKAENAEGFFGKVTVPLVYEDNGATDFIVSFCKHSWIDGAPFGVVDTQYAKAISPIISFLMEQTQLRGDHKEFVNLLKEKYGLKGLPILRMYDSLAKGFGSIHYLGAFVHTDFGGSTEIGMAIHRDNLSPQAYAAYIKPYLWGNHVLYWLAGFVLASFFIIKKTPTRGVWYVYECYRGSIAINALCVRDIALTIDQTTVSLRKKFS